MTNQEQVNMPLGINENNLAPTRSQANMPDFGDRSKDATTPDYSAYLSANELVIYQYIGRYSKYNTDEDHHYTYVNSLPLGGRTHEEIAHRLNMSVSTTNKIFCSLKDKGFVIYHAKGNPYYLLPNVKSIWQLIPSIKIDALLYYIYKHDKKNKDCLAFEIYNGLMYGYKTDQAFSITQLLSLYGRSNTDDNFKKAIDIIDHLQANRYCKIQYQENMAFGINYYTYLITDPMPDVMPTYIKRFNKTKDEQQLGVILKGGNQ